MADRHAGREIGDLPGFFEFQAQREGDSERGRHCVAGASHIRQLH